MARGTGPGGAGADMVGQGWMLTGVDIARDELVEMLKFVDSVEGLKRVHETVIEIVGDEKVEQLDSQTIWEVMFKEITDARIMEIVTLQLENLMATVNKEVDVMIAENSDVQEFVWTDSATDLGGVWGRGKAEKIGLGMKCWGWSTQLQDILRQLDTSLEKILESISCHPEILERSRDISCAPRTTNSVYWLGLKHGKYIYLFILCFIILGSSSVRSRCIKKPNVSNIQSKRDSWRWPR